jgi:Protein of unknown function (DUF4238)
MIRSHIIPAFYLKQFAFEKPNGKHYVYLYEKGKEPADRWTKNVGYEPGYFGYVLPDGTIEESLEGRLKTLEEDCMDALVSANSDLFVFTHRNRRKLALYAGHLHSRTTQRLEWSKRNWLEIYQQLDEAIKEDGYADELAQYFSVKLGKNLSRQSLRNDIKGLILRSATAERGKNNFLEELLDNTNMTADALSAKQVRIWKAPKDTQFVTSDNPLVSFVVVPNGEFAPGFGFRRQDALAFLPVSPTKCVLFGGDDPHEHFDIDAETMRKLNWAMIASAHHLVYGKTKDVGVQTMTNELIGTYVYAKTAFIPRGPLPNIKDFISHFLGLPAKPQMDET